MTAIEKNLSTIALVFVIIGCGDATPPTPRSTAASTNATGKDHGAIDFGDEFSSGKKGGDDEFEEISNNGSKGLDETLAECGEINLDQPDTIIVDNSMEGVRIVREGNLFGLGYRVTVDPRLQIRSSMLKSTTTVAFDVNASPFFAQGSADNEVAQRTGSSITEYFARDKRADVFAKDATWNGIVCTVQPAVRTINQIGGVNVVTKYEPALPAAISPTADPSRYSQEWQGGARTWQGIKATVQESTNETVPTGTTLTGTVSIRPIDSNVTVTDGDGSTHTIRADLAFELKADFGGSQVTNALGMSPITRFYIDHTGRTFAAIQSDTADGETPVATFIHYPGLR